MANEEQAEIRSFAILLQTLDEGTVHGDLSDELHKVLTELRRHSDSFGKAKGTLTLTLNVSCERGGTCDFGADIKSKTPRATRGKTVLWLTKNGHLSTSNPRQLELGVGPRAVPNAAIRDEKKGN